MALPNILYLHSHDTGRYLQPYGHAVPAPNLQRLADSGVLFRNAFCAAPTCSPSRAALLTGQSPHSSGMLGLAHRGFSLDDYTQHFVHTARSAGYRSTLIGMQHVAKEPQRIGYDEIVAAASSHSVDVTPAAVGFLKSEPAQPFFLNVGFSEVHREFPQPAGAYAADNCIPPAPLPDAPETRYDMAGFKAGAHLLDQGIGAILDALNASGLSDNTIVLYTTDHGPAFPRMKCNLTDHGIGVALILRVPGLVDRGVSDALVSHIDIFPTLCDLIGVSAPQWLEGKSLLPILRREADQVNDAVFAEVTYHAAYEPQRAVRTTRYKYIRRYGDRMIPVLPNCDDSPSKELLLRHGWAERPIPQEQLYDLIFDPNEAANLAERSEMAAVLAEMRDWLDGWMRATGDPLLDGPVAAPSGAQINDASGLSPRETPLAVA